MAEKKYFMNTFKNVFGPVIVSPVGRAVFPYLENPNKKFEPAKFALTILFDKKDPAVKKALNTLVALCNELSAQRYGSKVPAFKNPPFGNGDDEKNSKYQGFPGHYTMALRGVRRPETLDTQKQPIEPATILPGMFVRAVCRPLLYDDGFTWQLSDQGRFIGCVQLVKDDGVRLFGGPDSKSLLDSIGDVDTPDVSIDDAADAALGATAKTKSGKAAAVDLL